MYKKLGAFITVFLCVCLCGCSTNKDDTKNDNAIQNTAQAVNEQNSKPLLGKKILIDAGHGKADYTKKEPLSPGSREMKAAFVAGTSGANQTEAQLNLTVAKQLEARLKELGADVYMTRTDENATMSNVERAEYGNRLNADIAVRIHANGSEDKEVHGILTMVPAHDSINDEDVVSKSITAGEIIQKHLIASTQARDMGVEKHSDMTGFNWSKVPVVLVEMGFMTNKQEDAKLETPEYQGKIVQGITNGLLEYFL